MKESRTVLFILILTVVLTGIGTTPSYGLLIESLKEWAGLKKVEKKKAIYFCPMHPQIRRDKPGLCPICGMELVEMKEEKTEDILKFTPYQIQTLGIEFERVERRPLVKEIYTTGRVSTDERLLRTISVWIKGKSRIERLFVNFTGKTIERGEPLLTLYNPELVTTQREYLTLLKAGRDKALIESARRRLESWGITKREIKRIERLGRPLKELTIYSQVSGTVMELLVREGQYVKEGTPLFKVTGLERVWIEIDLYEDDLSYIQIGTPVEVIPETSTGTILKGRIEFIDPVVDKRRRTVRARLTVENKKGGLKPGGFVRVKVKSKVGRVLSVPEGAIVFTGRRAIAFVHEEGGVIKPVEVRVGRRWLYMEEGHRRYHEVLEGLEEGDKVVSKGTFLVLAEASLEGMLERFYREESPAIKAPAGLEETLEEILKPYEEIRKGLARDEIKETGRHVETLLRILKKTPPSLKPLFKDVKRAVEELKKAETLYSARQSFSRLSRALIEIIRRYNLSIAHAFYCPMAEKSLGYGGWLQPSETIENPYMGRKMSSCGRVLEDVP